MHLHSQCGKVFILPVLFIYFMTPPHPLICCNVFAMLSPTGCVMDLCHNASTENKWHGGQKGPYLLLESGCDVPQGNGSKASLKDRSAFACLSIRRGRKASCSPDVELLARLRSSSATQDKFQYPLGTPVAVLLPNGPPVKTENPDFNLRSMPTHIRPCLCCQRSH